MKIQTIEIKLKGMSCSACAVRIQKKLSTTNGVSEASVNYASEKATIAFDTDTVKPFMFPKIVQSIGYDAEIIEREDPDKDRREKAKEIRSLRNRFIVSAALSFPLLLAMFFSLLSIDAGFLHNFYFQLLLATPVQFVIGFRFYKNAFLSLKSLSPGMDLLVAVGTSAAYFFSVYLGLQNPHAQHTYFEASAVVITLILLGKYLEARAKGKTNDAIRKLLDLTPKTARVIRDGAEVDIPASDIASNELIVIKPGERIPADGIISDGDTSVDESMITGESMPVDKKTGDLVIGGTVNLYGSVRYRATKIGKESFLSQLIGLIEQAQNAKAPIQKLADKVAGIFAPMVFGIALLTFTIWLIASGDITHAVLAAVSVLVIACPCALGLATPTAIMVGVGKGAEKGILIRSSDALELAHRLTTVIFDKTGTLTVGKPSVTDVIATGAVTETELIRLAASVEKSSEHPIAQSVVRFAAERYIDLASTEKFLAIPGKGVRATLDGEEVFVGTMSFLAESGINIEGSTQTARLEAQGKTTMAVGRNGALIGFIALADTLKSGSREAIFELQRMGLKTVMLTGDNPLTAKAIAEACGISEAYAGALPDRKAQIVAELKAAGETVAMIGDGINDAPALATADIGIAIGAGTDIAIETSDITLIRGDLSDVATAIRLSKKTMRKIRQNLFWAFFYNIIGIPFAALGLLSPVIAGAAMAFSSISVVTNSLSLKRFK